MKNRCTQKTHRAYKNYGGRGIAFCERWVSYQNFVADMGERPEGTSLDRIDPNGNYEPLNCRWISGESQSFNKRSTIILTFNGKTQNTKEWGKELGIKPKTIAERFRKGWPVERILGVEKVTA